MQTALNEEELIEKKGREGKHEVVREKRRRKLVIEEKDIGREEERVVVVAQEVEKEIKGKHERLQYCPYINAESPVCSHKRYVLNL